MALWRDMGPEAMALPAAVAAVTTSVLFVAREVLYVIAGVSRRTGRHEAADRAVMERHGLSLLRAADQLFESSARFVRFSEARWYSDPLDPGLKNALNHQAAVFFALLRLIQANTYFEFSAKRSQARRFAERAQACYDALTDAHPVAAEGEQASPKSSGVLRREDLELLGERALVQGRQGVRPPSYAEFMEGFVDLGLGPRAELAPLIHFFAAAERGGPRRHQVVAFLVALGALRALLQRLPPANIAPPAHKTVTIPGLDTLSLAEQTAWRRTYRQLGRKLALEDGPLAAG